MHADQVDIGVDTVLRFPLRPDPGLRDALRHEQDTVRRIAPHVPVEVPEPLALGEPGAGYPGAWTAYRWIPGQVADAAGVTDPFALDLAGFVAARHGTDTAGRSWDGRSRGGPLPGCDADVRAALDAAAGLVDTAALGALWRRCRDTAGHRGPDRWLHADLMPGNLLTRGGRLSAVIDFGASCGVAAHRRPARRRRRRRGSSYRRDGRLHAEKVKAIAEPPSLVDLRRRLEVMLPRVDMGELILEVMSWQQRFVHAFTVVPAARPGWRICTSRSRRR